MIWTTSRNAAGRELAKRLGAHRTFDANETLPRKVQVVVDSIGPVSWEHSLASVARGGTIIVTGGTTGFDVRLSLLSIISDQITVCGSIMGTLQDMKNMIAFISGAGIAPEKGGFFLWSAQRKPSGRCGRAGPTARRFSPDSRQDVTKEHA